MKIPFEIKRILKFLWYLLFAQHRRGFGIHSPFVFDLLTTVLNRKEKNEYLTEIQKIRRALLNRNEKITYHDPGASSMKTGKTTRSVSQITKSTSTPEKYGKLLFFMVRKYRPAIILEIGTSLGLGTLYLSGADENAEVITFEGVEPLITIAKANFKKLSRRNIKLIQGKFQLTLPKELEKIKRIDLIYFDGHHTFNATWSYFSQCLLKIHNDSIFVFDDIHWSEEMEKVWDQIKRHPDVRVTIDLFRMGLVFFKRELSKQHYVIKY